MNTLPQAMIDEIAALETLDARALKRKYPQLLADTEDCAVSSVLRSLVAYRLQERFYALPLPEDAREWLSAGDGDSSRVFPKARKLGSSARLIRIWKGARHEAVVREDGRFEYQGRIFNSLSAIAREITLTRWNGKLFFGVK